LPHSFVLFLNFCIACLQSSLYPFHSAGASFTLTFLCNITASSSSVFFPVSHLEIFFHLETSSTYELHLFMTAYERNTFTLICFYWHHMFTRIDYRKLFYAYFIDNVCGVKHVCVSQRGIFLKCSCICWHFNFSSGVF
jgi:hypothetical protein